MSFSKFTDEQWAAIRAARGNWSARINWPAVRRDLEAAGRDFWTLRTKRLRHGSPVAERKRLKAALQQVHDLRMTLASLQPPATGWGNTFDDVERTLGNRLSVYDAWGGQPFKGRADAHRALLYQRALHQWTGPLKGELVLARRESGLAAGPAVVFLVAVLQPILGDQAPKPNGAAGIIKTERERRTLMPATLKAFKAFWTAREKRSRQ